MELKINKQIWNIPFESWDDIHPVILERCLVYYLDKAFKEKLFIEVLKHNHVPIHQLSTLQKIQIFNNIDTIWMDTAPLKPFIPSFKYRWRTYLFGKEKMMTATAMEFVLSDMYYNDFANATDPLKSEEALTRLLTVIARQKATDKDYIAKSEDERIPIVSQYDVEHRAKDMMHIPFPVKLSAAIYYKSNIEFIMNLYGKHIFSSSGKSDGLGWHSLFMSIAETGVFGDLESVYQQKIHPLFAFLVKKKKEAIEIENQTKKQ